MCKAVFFVLVLVALSCCNEQDGPTAVDQFTAEFTLNLTYSLTFGSNNKKEYDPAPFLWSPPIQPLKGKIYFSYPTAQLRIDFTSGAGSPWELQSTTIVNSFNYQRGDYTFNFTSNIYQSGGPSKCWYGTYLFTNVPNQMGGDLNLTYEGYKVVDGYESMIWQSDGGSVFAVRLLDLAVVQINLPYLLTQAVPIFPLFGLGEGHTIIDFENIVIGAPDPSNFLPPTGICIDVYPTPTSPKIIHYKQIPEFTKKLLTNNPLASLYDKAKNFNPFTAVTEKLHQMKTINEKKANLIEKREVSQGPYPPKLNQTFSARWTLNASTDLNPPYTPYTISGKLAFDFTKSGLAWSIDSITGNIPLNMLTEFRLYPSRNGVEFIQVGPDGSCYSYVFLQWLWTYLVPDFEVPYNVAQEPNVVINGDNCTVWQTTWNWYTAYAELFVRDSDHVLVRITAPEPFGHGLGTVTLTEIETKVDPIAYSRPDTCVETMTWNHNWNSHLPWDWCIPFC